MKNCKPIPFRLLSILAGVGVYALFRFVHAHGMDCGMDATLFAMKEVLGENAYNTFLETAKRY